MPLALRQLRTLLVQVSQVGVEVDQERARRLLMQLFPKRLLNSPCQGDRCL